MKPIYSVASKLQTREQETITDMILKMVLGVAVGVALMFLLFASNPQLAKADSKLLTHIFKNIVRTENVFYQVKIGNDYSCEEKKKLIEVMKRDIYEIDMQSCDIPAPYCGDGIKQEREQCDTGGNTDECDGCKKVYLEATGGCPEGKIEKKGECVLSPKKK